MYSVESVIIRNPSVYRVGIGGLIISYLVNYVPEESGNCLSALGIKETYSLYNIT